MADILSKEKRSAIMSAIRSKNNKSTEIRMLHLLRTHKIKGWRRHLNLPGRPDFSWPQKKIAVFIDGCFWHGCTQCYKAPRSNTEYWIKKISSNKARDKRANKLLRVKGWTVLRIKECQLESPAKCKKILLRIQVLTQ